jgi:hypothetical protein
MKKAAHGLAMGCNWWSRFNSFVTTGRVPLVFLLSEAWEPGETVVHEAEPPGETPAQDAPAGPAAIQPQAVIAEPDELPALAAPVVRAAIQALDAKPELVATVVQDAIPAPDATAECCELLALRLPLGGLQAGCVPEQSSALQPRP